MPVSKTISSQNSGGTLHYLLDGVAHDSTLTNKRFVHGNINNLDLDYNNQPNSRYFASQFIVSRHKTNKYIKTHKDKKTQCYHLIFSFNEHEFDCTNLEKQSIQALALTQDYLKERMPQTAQWLVVVQADGKGHKLHTHVAINSVNVDGKVLNSNLVTQTGKDGIRETFNDFLDTHFEPMTGRKFERVCPQYHLDNLTTPKERDGLANRKTMYDWKNDLKSRILTAMEDTCNLDDFERHLNDLGVSVTKRNRSTGQIDSTGKKIKRASYTYSFTDKDNKKRRSVDLAFNKHGQARGLGEIFRPQNIEQYQKDHQPVDDGSADLAELDSLVNETLSEMAESSTANVPASTVVVSSVTASTASTVRSHVEQSARSMQQRRRNREAVESSVTPTASQRDALYALSMRAENAEGRFKASAVKEYRDAVRAVYHPSSTASEGAKPASSASTAQSTENQTKDDDLTL